MKGKKIFYIDTETYSPVDLKKCGSHKYFEHPDSCIMILSYAQSKLVTWALDFTGFAEDTKVSNATTTLKESLENAAKLYTMIQNDPDIVLASHNAEFDMQAVARPPLNWKIPRERWVCTMSVAAAHGLPMGLDQLCQTLGVKEEYKKKGFGRALVMKYCCPDKEGNRRTPKTDIEKEEWANFLAYARFDISAMRSCMSKFSWVNYPVLSEENAFYQETLALNFAGVEIDLNFATAIIDEIAAQKTERDKVVKEKTIGMIESATQGKILKEFLAEYYGVTLENMQKAYLSKILDDESLPEPVKELLRLRIESSGTASAKYAVMKRMACLDGTAKGLIQYCGAARTGRDGGRMIQVQNLPRPLRVFTEERIQRGIDAAVCGILPDIEPDIVGLAKSAIRHAIRAPKGHYFIIADLAGIEGRGVVWLAGEEWKLRAFRDIDAKRGHDIYKQSYAKTFGGSAESVTDAQRQVGKCMELFLGYEGGMGAFVKGAATTGLDIAKMAETVYGMGGMAEDIAQADDFVQYLYKRNPEMVKPVIDKIGLRNAIAAEVVKRRWRDAHPAISALWPACELAAKQALANPGDLFAAGQKLNFLYSRDSRMLYMILPSGRRLCYFNARISAETRAIEFLGKNQLTGKWEMQQTYSGKLVENATQAAMRDIFRDWVLGVKKVYGLTASLRVHDECAWAVPDWLLLEPRDFEQCLIDTRQPWSRGLPLAAKGFSSEFYCKK